MGGPWNSWGWRGLLKRGASINPRDLRLAGVPGPKKYVKQQKVIS